VQFTAEKILTGRDPNAHKTAGNFYLDLTDYILITASWEASKKQAE
jgi:hypothetical protein